MRDRRGVPTGALSEGPWSRTSGLQSRSEETSVVYEPLSGVCYSSQMDQDSSFYIFPCNLQASKKIRQKSRKTFFAVLLRVTGCFWWARKSSVNYVGNSSDVRKVQGGV